MTKENKVPGRGEEITPENEASLWPEGAKGTWVSDGGCWVGRDHQMKVFSLRKTTAAPPSSSPSPAPVLAFDLLRWNICAAQRNKRAKIPQTCDWGLKKTQESSESPSENISCSIFPTLPRRLLQGSWAVNPRKRGSKKPERLFITGCSRFCPFEASFIGLSGWKRSGCRFSSSRSVFHRRAFLARTSDASWRFPSFDGWCWGESWEKKKTGWNVSGEWFWLKTSYQELKAERQHLPDKSAFITVLWVFLGRTKCSRRVELRPVWPRGSGVMVVYMHTFPMGR